MKRPARRLRQSGAVALLIVAFLLMGGLLLGYSALNVASVRVDRERSTNNALAKAKDALIAFAVSHVGDPGALPTPIPARPGQLPCPDVNDDGVADANVSTGACTSLIGRLPWITLGLPDLRDDSGERLWYVVSNDFRTDYNVPPAVPLNSDTAFRATNASLSLAGTTPATNLVAIVMSPGGTLTRTDGRVQSRACGAVCDPRDFLDIAAGEDNADANRIFVAASRSTSFNDTLLPVFSDDIMRLVERRAAREFAKNMRDHYDLWAGALVNNTKGFYPWAWPLNNPSLPAPGLSGTLAGQLPLSAASVVWNTASAPLLTSCNGVNTAEIQCSGILLVSTLLTINGTVRDVGTAFIDPPSNANVDVLNGTVLFPNITWTLNPGTQTLSFTYSGLGVGLPLVVRVRAPGASAWTTSSWLAYNNWHQNGFYALSSGYALNGSDTCGGAGPACISILNSNAPSTMRAVALMSGRALTSAGQATRPIAPPANPNEFFELQNVDATDATFERNVRSDTFNDSLAGDTGNPSPALRIWPRP